MTAQPIDEQAAPEVALSDDVFTDDRDPGAVIGSTGPKGAVRLGVDVESQVSIDHGALRFEPLAKPGWGREAIAYGPFAPEAGLAFVAHVLNGHNASQTYYFPETKRAALRRWLGEARRGKFRREHHYENLAVGFVADPANADPLVDSHAFVMHAASEDNGELWVTERGRRVRVALGVQNLPFLFVAVTRRDGGAAYYLSSVADARGAATYPMLRPVGISAGTPARTPTYAAIQQRIIGEVGYREATRVYATRVAHLPDWTDWWGSASVADRFIGHGPVIGTAAEHGGTWQTIGEAGPERTDEGARATGSGPAGASQMLEDAVGLVRATFTSPGTGAVELRWGNASTQWRARLDQHGCTVNEIGPAESSRLLAIDQSRRLRRGHQTVQVLDDGATVAVHVDGELVGERWLSRAPSATDVVGFVVEGDAVISGFEAHPAEIALPPALDVGAPWQPPASQPEFDERFDLEADDLDGASTPSGGRLWERSLGPGGIVLRGEGQARVRATRDEPNPDRTVFTVPWDDPTFADVSVEMTIPGTARGQGENGRVGLVFWQDADNFLIINYYVDDVFDGASISTFYHLDGYENMYDAVWTLIPDVRWGTRCTLRAAFDGERFLSWSNGEACLVRALTDVYPATPPLTINRVGIIVNEEWGNDTGTTIHRFSAARRADAG
jgi:hypothetical protein